MNILALDIAIKTGWAFWNEDEKRIRYGLWYLRFNGRQEVLNLQDRILKAHEHWGVGLIACEDAAMGSNNFRTGAWHGELRGVTRLMAANIGAEFRTIPPSTLKKYATGNGHAKKPQMIAACKTLLGIETDDDNIADALWVLNWARGFKGHTGESRQRPKRKARRRDKQGKLFS